MPEFNLDAAAAIRAKIFRTLTNGNPSNSSFLSYLTAGIPITTDMLKFLSGEDVYSAEVFAQQTNGIPAGVGDWVAGTSKIWSVYKNWINSYDPPPYTPSEKDQEAFNAAVEIVNENIENYIDFRTSYMEARLAFDLLTFTPYNMRDKNYQIELAKAKIAMQNALDLWQSKGNRDLVENAQANMIRYGRKNPERTRKYLTDLLGEPISIGTTDFYPTSLFPSDFYKGDVAWPKFRMNASDIKEFKNDRNVNFGGQGNVDATAFQIELDGEGEVVFKEQQIDTDKMEIEFEMTRATILRPWLDTFLMFSNGWKWETQTRENPDSEYLLSDGRIPPQDGMLKMIPTEVIFARNIRITLKQESTKNQQFLLDVKGGASFGFGPFKISGNIHWKENESKIDTKVTEDSIICETMQIIGFFCQLSPKSPNPDWSLWPKETEVAAEQNSMETKL